MKPSSWADLRGVENIRLLWSTGDQDFFVGERRIAPGFTVEVWFAGIPKKPESQNSAKASLKTSRTIARRRMIAARPMP
jgi:hypothetical protein